MSRTDPVAHDTEQAAAEEAHARAWDILHAHQDKMHAVAGDRRRMNGRACEWTMSITAVREVLVARSGDSNIRLAMAAAGALAEEEKHTAEIAGALAEVTHLEAIYRDAPWSRYFRCLNPDGHIHSSARGCSTVRPTTPMAWEVHLSGRPAEDAIADLGPTLCSVCFPDAPAEHCRKRSDIEREARDAARAAREEAKFIKRLRPDEVFRTGGRFSERIETVAACKEVLRREVEFRDYYGRGEHPEHRSYIEGAAKAAAVLLAREAAQAGTGATQEQISKIIASAVKRNIKDGARLDSEGNVTVR